MTIETWVLAHLACGTLLLAGAFGAGMLAWHACEAHAAAAYVRREGVRAFAGRLIAEPRDCARTCVFALAASVLVMAAEVALGATFGFVLCALALAFGIKRTDAETARWAHACADARIKQRGWR